MDTLLTWQFGEVMIYMLVVFVWMMVIWSDGVLADSGDREGAGASTTRSADTAYDTVGSCRRKGKAG